MGRPDGFPGRAGVTAIPSEGLQIVDDRVGQRYEARLDGRVVGYTDYRRVRGRIIFVHTEVDPAMEGRGIGGRLAAGALDDVRAQGLKFSAKCPFIAAYVKRHPEYDDIRVDLDSGQPPTT
jgi:predicted GNAT family acetyltransferase